MIHTFILISLITHLFAFESSDSFQVKIYDQSIKVISPKNFNKTQYVVIENQTLSKIIGKLTTESGELITAVSVEQQQSKSIPFKVEKEGKVIFTPLSPPFQEVELVVGQKEYEIPPKR